MEAEDTVIKPKDMLDKEGKNKYEWYSISSGWQTDKERLCEDQAEISFEAGEQEGRREMAIDLFQDVICPMCYRLNPQHSTENFGTGCKSCGEKESYCGRGTEGEE